MSTPGPEPPWISRSGLVSYRFDVLAGCVTVSPDAGVAPSGVVDVDPVVPPVAVDELSADLFDPR